MKSVVFELSSDLGVFEQGVIIIAVIFSLLLIFMELRIQAKGAFILRLALFVASSFATIALALALLRPVSSQVAGSNQAKVAHIWLDASVRGDLPSDEPGKSRLQKAEELFDELRERSDAESNSTEWVVHRLSNIKVA